MAYSYKGAISFGLVYIPVALQAGVKVNDIGFNMLDEKTMSRVKYKKTCVDCGDREVWQEDIVRGYEYEKGRYVVFTDEELDSLKTPREKNITIECFVDLSEVDPVYFQKAYTVIPTGAERAYKLLLSAMEEENKAGLAKTVLGTKETLILLRAREGRMALSTLYFADEVQQTGVYASDVKVDPKELELAKSIIQNMAKPFEPEKYHDTYREKVLAAISQKVAGNKIEVPRERAEHGVSDLMEALKRSLMSSAALTPAEDKLKAAEAFAPPPKKRAAAKPKGEKKAK